MFIEANNKIKFNSLKRVLNIEIKKHLNMETANFGSRKPNLLSDSKSDAS